MPKKNRGYRLEWRKESEVWEVIWFVQGRRKRKSTGTKSRAEADKFLIRYIDSQQRRQTTRVIGDILADYQEEHAPLASDPVRIGHCILRLIPFFGEMGIEELNATQCKEYASEREAKAGTIRRELQTLRAALNHDKRSGRLESVPYIWMPAAAQAKDRWLTRKEAARLLRASRNITYYLPWFILISLYSGQRKMAVLNLTWDRVDLERGKINWQYGRETKKRRIVQPMPDELWMFLRLLARHGTKGHVINDFGRGLGDIRKGFQEATKEAGLKFVTPHTLKHTAITWMLQNGTDLWAVAGFTGTSVKTLESTYGHHSPDHLESARTSFKMARKRRLTAR
jgi:integrase